MFFNVYRGYYLQEKPVEYVAREMVRYVSELKFFDCDFFRTIDTDDATRIGIKFFFKQVTKHIYVIPPELTYSNSVLDYADLYKKNIPTVTEREG